MTAPEIVIINPNLHPDLVVYPAAGARLAEGSVLTADRQELRLGAGAYTGLMLTALGRRVGFVDSVGNDVFGQFTITELERLDFDLSLVDRYEGDHMVVVSVADELSGGGTMIGTTPFAWQRPLSELESLLGRTPAVSAAYVWSWFWSYSNRWLREAQTSRLLSGVRDKAGLVLLDPNWKPHGSPPRQEVAELVAALRFVDILKLNETDARVIVGDVEPAAAARTLVGLGPSIVVLTLGERGCIVADRKGRGSVALPALDGQPRDTTGAGDYFGGALLDALLHGDQPVGAAAFALAATGLAIGRSADDPLPRAAAIDQEAAAIARRAIAA